MRRGLAVGGLALLLSTTAGVALAQPGPNGHNNHGLCTAYFNGSANGQAHKRNAPPFQGLEQAAADAGQSVEEFCAGLVGGRAGRP
jgi:hypothetical protein